MLTEQEVIAQLNDKINNKDIKPSTSRYLAKIEIMKTILEKQQIELDGLRDKERAIELDIQRSKGAISILLELAAEDEGMLSKTVEIAKTTE